MLQHNLNSELVTDILDFLDCPEKRPTLRYLNNLIYKYIRKVPWESVSRIVKRHTVRNTKDCPRLPKEFWTDAIQYGYGGTCYESSLAFFSLLTALGYKGYLTVNDMGDTRGCHAAMIIEIKEQKYLVDVTIPVHKAVKISPQRITRNRTSFANFTIRPVQENQYQVERSHHPNKYAFTLIDRPVNLPEYLSIVENDYEQTGHFLKSVVMVKVIGDKTWRYSSRNHPCTLEHFNRDGKYELVMEPGSVAHTLAKTFQMPEDQISAAMSWVQADTTPTIRPLIGTEGVTA